MGLLDGSTQDYHQGNDYGNYQFISLQELIAQFEIAYVGEDKIISKINKLDIAFHAQRALQELSFDTLKSVKAREITLPPSLQMVLPEDYVNYTKVSWVDSAGIKHLLYPTSKTSNPEKYQTDANGEFLFNDNKEKISSGELISNGNFHGGSDGWGNNSATQQALGKFGLEDGNILGSGTAYLDPVTGWFYQKNSIRGYNLPQYAAAIQRNVSIISGEQYSITYTISNYSSGQYNVVIVDEKGDYSFTQGKSANGTYTEIITAGGELAGYPKSSVYFQNSGATNASGLNVVIDNISVVRVGDEEPNVTWSSYKSGTPSENQDDYQDDTYWPMEGSRYGLDPQHAQANGSFYIDNQSGKIHFSSNVSGKTVILDYISDSLGTDGEMQVHKFAEEAMYKCIAYAILSTRANVQENVVRRYKKERFAAIRTAKLRLSNIKLEELTQILRGKSKQIKH